MVCDFLCEYFSDELDDHGSARERCAGEESPAMDETSDDDGVFLGGSRVEGSILSEEFCGAEGFSVARQRCSGVEEARGGGSVGRVGDGLAQRGERPGGGRQRGLEREAAAAGGRAVGRELRGSERAHLLLRALR